MCYSGFRQTEISKDLLSVQDLLPHYRAVTEEYMAALSSLGLRLVRLIALALYCPRDYFDDMFATPTTTLRPLHYSAAVSDPKLGLFGAGEL